jgi:flagellar biosynthesis component FlhA
MAMLGVVPGLPFLPFATLGGLMAFVGFAIPRRIAKDRLEESARQAAKDEQAKAETRGSIREQLKSFEVELCLSKELNAALIHSRDEIASRIAKMRRKFARQYGFVVPEIRLTDDLKAPPKTYQIKIHGTAVATQELRVREHLVIIGDGPRPDLPGDEVREPAFGIRAIAIPEAQLPARLWTAAYRPIDEAPRPRIPGPVVRVVRGLVADAAHLPAQLWEAADRQIDLAPTPPMPAPDAGLTTPQADVSHLSPP